MSLLAHPSAENSLKIEMFGVDDHKKELGAAVLAAKEARFNASTYDTATQWARAVRRADDKSILIADNRMEALNDLSSVGYSNIDTASGNNAGLKLLTEFCDREQINSGLKILFTAYAMSSEEINSIERRNKRKNDNIHVIYKYDRKLKLTISDIFSEFYKRKYMDFLREKFEFVSAVMEEWSLSNIERGQLLGVVSEKDAAIIALKEGNTASRDLESRCDLIFRLRLNLELLFGRDFGLHNRWLHAKLSTESGGAKVGHGSGGIVQPRAE